MNPTQVILNITSEDPARLYDFYRNTLGLPAQEGMGDTAVSVAGMILIFDGHSEVKGPNRDPARYLFDMVVEDIAAEQSALEAKGVKFIRSQGKEEWGGIISTMADPDGNYVQLMEFHPPSAE